MRVCNLYGISDNVEGLEGVVYLQNGVLSARYAPGMQTLVEGLMDRPNVTANATISPEDDPEAWFDALPTMYHGSYFWAEMQPETEAHRL